MKRYLLVGLALALFGCASSAPRIDASRLIEIRKGETRVADLVGRFGRPSLLSKNMDGTQTAVYVHAEGLAGATALVPVIGAISGHADANVDSVIFQFDVKGVLTDYKITQAKAPGPLPALANARKPALDSAGTATQTEASKPALRAKKQAAEESNPWVIRGWSPSGWRENR